MSCELLIQKKIKVLRNKQKTRTKCYVTFEIKISLRF